jgi:hypothetical protein
MEFAMSPLVCLYQALLAHLVSFTLEKGEKRMFPAVPLQITNFAVGFALISFAYL